MFSWQLPAAVGEEPSFSYGPETLKELCVPIGVSLFLEYIFLYLVVITASKPITSNIVHPALFTPGYFTDYQKDSNYEIDKLESSVKKQAWFILGWFNCQCESSIAPHECLL